MIATVSDDLSAGTEVVQNFEFRAVPATAAMVEARVKALVDAAVLNVKYFDTNAGAAQWENFYNLLVQSNFGTFEAASVMVIDWDVDDNASFAGSILTADTDVADEVITITVTVTIDMDNEGTDDAEYEREYEVILFESVIHVA